MKNKKFLFIPVVLFLFLFLLDKIFLLDAVKPYIKSDFTYIYYEAKTDLLKQLIQRAKAGKQQKKLMILLGSSRLLYFDAKELEEFYPDWDIYNFSSAVTTPAYYAYFLERLIEGGVRPDLIVMESDPNQFNESTPVFKNSNLTYSFDLPFIMKYSFVFGKEYVSFYLGKFLFASSKNKPYLDIAYKRLKDPNHKIIYDMRKKVRDHLLTNKGHAMSPVEGFIEKDFARLQATSERTVAWLFSNYIESEMQYTFFENILQKIKNAKIPLIVVWPQSSLPMQELLKSAKSTDRWWTKTKGLVERYGFKLHDLDNTDEFYCNSFADGGHMARDCYHPLMRFVMLQYYKEGQ
ncbi:MAG: DUF1574 domain-containing protein [Leptospiraceae bacterium]|nr:DUF1574 domain-containing protein [Leptospiraceae bacterium]MCP5494929.1 DUF1574 domain-containing protein [Leptospiraceae bacterium]